MTKTPSDIFDLKSFEDLYNGLSDEEELLKDIPDMDEFLKDIPTFDEFWDALKRK